MQPPKKKKVGPRGNFGLRKTCPSLEQPRRRQAAGQCQGWHRREVAEREEVAEAPAPSKWPKEKRSSRSTAREVAERHEVAEEPRP